MKKIKLFSVLTFGALILGACGSGSSQEKPKVSDDTAKQETKQGEVKENQKKDDSEIFKDDTLETESVKIQYTGSEKGTDYDDKPLLYTFFTVTNKSEEAKNAQVLLIGNVDFSQNLGSTTKKLEYGITMESPHKDKLDLLQQDVNPDGTIEMAYALKIEDESKPVTITFKDGMVGKEVGKIDVDVK